LENVTDKPPSAEKIAILRFYRRAAIRALAQVRFPIVTHPSTNDKVYPLWPLAKIAVNDGSVSPPITPDEVAEAVTGLCNYQQFRGVEVDVLLDIIALGVFNFASPKAAATDDRSILWRVYAARVGAALDHLRKTAANNAGLTQYAGKVNSLADAAAANVLSRIDKLGAGQTTQPPAPNELQAWRSRNPVPALAPFTDAKGMVLKPAAPRS
jgi:hypothetical protein